MSAVFRDSLRIASFTYTFDSFATIFSTSETCFYGYLSLQGQLFWLPTVRFPTAGYLEAEFIQDSHWRVVLFSNIGSVCIDKDLCPFVDCPAPNKRN